MKKLLLSIFVFRLIGSAQEIQCGGFQRFECGFSAWDCSTMKSYECLTNIEMDNLQQHEISKDRKHYENKLPTAWGRM